MDLRKSALILTDLQNDFLHPQGLLHRLGHAALTEEERASLIGRARELAAGMRAAGRPVVWVRTALRPDHLDSALSPKLRDELGLTPESGFVVEGSWGAEIIGELRPEPQDLSITKTGHSAFQFTHLDRLLANLEVSACVMVAGGTLDGLEESVRHGAALGYEVLIPLDAVGAAARAHHRVWSMTAALTTTEEVLADLQAPPSGEPAPSPDGTALLVVDLQNDFVHPQGVKARLGYSVMSEEDRSAIIENNQLLAQSMRRAGGPVLFIKVGVRPDNLDRAWPRAARRAKPIAPEERYLAEGSWGAEVAEGVDVLDDDFTVIKKGNSGFGFTPLHRILRNLGVRHCIVSGGAVHGCVEATVREGVGLGYTFTVVPDAMYPPGGLIPELLGTHADIRDTRDVVAGLRQTA